MIGGYTGQDGPVCLDDRRAILPAASLTLADSKPAPHAPPHLAQ